MAYHRIENFQYISFDVFDTLILRSVAKPTDLFELMEQMSVPHGFAKKRLQAEQAAWDDWRRPVTIDEIYAHLDGIDKDECMRIKELEQEMELSGCVANPVMVDIFRQCLDAGKTVVLISDMYLSSEMIGAMLDKCGICGYKKMYVSCEYGVNKRGGQLYQEVLKDLGIKPSQIVHIGDNLKTDVLRPMLLGMHTTWVKNDRRKLCRIPHGISSDFALMQRTVQTCVSNTSTSLSDVQRQGCSIFGPLLYGFTVWLAEQLKKDGIKDAYFLSRDGWIMKKAFDEFQFPGIKTHYLYGSRRAFIVPILWRHSTFDDMFSWFSIKRSTLRSILERLGLEPERYQKEAALHHLCLDTVFSSKEFYISKDIRAFYEEIKKDVIDNSKKEYTALLSYIKTIDMDSKIAFIDIGYYGTMQHAFLDFLKAASLNVEIHGYYVGVSAGKRKYPDMKTSGYLFDLNHNAALWEEIEQFLGIFEAPFLALHGSVKRFILQDGHGVPELYSFEYASPEGMRVDEQQFITDIQKGAISFIRQMHKSFPNIFPNIQPEVALHPFKRLGLEPTLKEAKQWGDIRAFNFNEIRWMAVPPKWTIIWECLLHPGRIKDYSLCIPWKIGFLKRVFRVPFPYNHICNLIYNFSKKKGM